MNIFSKKLYILTEQNDHYRQLVESYNLPNLEITQDKQDAQVLLAAPPLLAKCLDEFTSLEWVQSVYAGVDALVKDSLRQDYLLTNLKGIFGQQIAEYVLGFTIAHYRHFLEYREQQANKDWHSIPYTCLDSQTMVIVGTGEIGSHLAKTAKAFGLKVIGVNTRGIPKPDSPFDDIYHIDELSNAIASANIVVSTLPETPDTRGIFNKQSFALARSILFFNVGRGTSINQAALLESLDQNKIAHAFLDVFEQEPLAHYHPYWSHPNITVTPHIAAVSFPEQVVEIFADYYLDWEQGYTLHNTIDFSKGY